MSDDKLWFLFGSSVFLQCTAFVFFIYLFILMQYWINNHMEKQWIRSDCCVSIREIASPVAKLTSKMPAADNGKSLRIENNSVERAICGRSSVRSFVEGKFFSIKMNTKSPQRALGVRLLSNCGHRKAYQIDLFWHFMQSMTVYTRSSRWKWNWKKTELALVLASKHNLP